MPNVNWQKQSPVRDSEMIYLMLFGVNLTPRVRCPKTRDDNQGYEKLLGAAEEFFIYGGVGDYGLKVRDGGRIILLSILGGRA